MSVGRAIAKKHLSLGGVHGNIVCSKKGVNGDVDDTMTMEDIHIRGLTGLDTVGNNVRG